MSINQELKDFHTQITDEIIITIKHMMNKQYWLVEQSQ